MKTDLMNKKVLRFVREKVAASAAVSEFKLNTLDCCLMAKDQCNEL